MRRANITVPCTRSGEIGTARKVAGLLLLAGCLAACLAGCDMVDAVFEGLKHASAVEADLALTTGVKPAVGFNWHNGRLTSVTVTFPSLLEDKPLHDLAETVRTAVGKEFKQRADDVVLAFSLGPSATRTARAGQP